MYSLVHPQTQATALHCGAYHNGRPSLVGGHWQAVASCIALECHQGGAHLLQLTLRVALGHHVVHRQLCMHTCVVVCVAENSTNRVRHHTSELVGR